MGRSLIQTANTSEQAIAENGTFALGTIVRRYGKNLQLAGNGIEATGVGYFAVTASVSVTPTAAGPVTVALYDNGVQVPGAIAYGSASDTDSPVTLAIVATIRRGCCCANADSLTLVLLEGAGTGQNVSVRVSEE